MIFNFATIFYANYSSKGVALYRSIERHCDCFHMYIFAMDKECETLLDLLSLHNATVVSVAELEAFYPDLLHVKPSRKKGEYSWTCKGPALLFCYEKYGLEDCTYLDADMFFFNDPTPLFSENPTADVMLIDHRYSDAYNLTETNGKYCAGFMYFKFTTNGLDILRHWAEQCIDWCYASPEMGKFGDQKYLDEFHEKWNNVHDIQHIGLCAPWNIQRYSLFVTNDKIQVALDGQQDDLICYHFHFLRNKVLGKYNELYLGPYYLSKQIREHVYSPYIEELMDFTRYVDEVMPGCDALASYVMAGSKMHFMIHCMKNAWKRNTIIWKRK